MNNPIVISVVSWFFPGAGHFALGDIKKGLIIAGVIWSMFVIAVVSGGAYYPGLTFEEGALLYILNIFARMGNGLGAIISLILNSNPPVNVAAWGTFEYGGRFLEVAGLLNFLAIIDALDLQSGRKE
jgi:TM2 domain-containing membrane protein YozV